MSILHRKPKTLARKSLQQIVNVDPELPQPCNQQQQLFMADLAQHCNNLLNWVANPASSCLAESLWKNKMRTKAEERFRNLDADEIRRLVDRDWRIMNQGHRKKIQAEFQQVQSAGELQGRVETLRDRIEQAKRQWKNK